MNNISSMFLLTGLPVPTSGCIVRKIILQSMFESCKEKIIYKMKEK